MDAQAGGIFQGGAGVADTRPVVLCVLGGASWCRTLGGAYPVSTAPQLPTCLALEWGFLPRELQPSWELSCPSPGIRCLLWRGSRGQAQIHPFPARPCPGLTGSLCLLTVQQDSSFSLGWRQAGYYGAARHPDATAWAFPLPHLRLRGVAPGGRRRAAAAGPVTNPQ